MPSQGTSAAGGPDAGARGAADIRTNLPRLGTRKRLHVLSGLGEHAPRVDRNPLFALLAGYDPFIRCKRRVVTTQTCLPQFRRPNLIEHLRMHRAERVSGSATSSTCACSAAGAI